VGGACELAMAQRDNHTGELFDWTPPQVGVGYVDDVAGRGTLDAQISRLLARALRDAGDNKRLSRSDVAAAMARELGRAVSKDILDKWTSEASNSNRIPLDAFIALIKVTDATELLGFIPGLMGFVVVSEEYEDLIIKIKIAEHRAQIDAWEASIDAKSKGRRR